MRQEEQCTVNMDVKLPFSAWLFGLHRKKVWYILLKGKRADGPYCLEELKNKFSGTNLEVGLRIRKGKKGQWMAWVNALATYPLLAYTNTVASDNRQVGKSNTKKTRKKDQTIEGEKEVWFLQTKRKKRKGPYSLQELSTVCKSFTVDDGIRICKGKSGQWYDWLKASELYPVLPKPNSGEMPNQSVCDPSERVKEARMPAEGKSDIFRHVKKLTAKNKRLSMSKMFAVMDIFCDEFELPNYQNKKVSSLQQDSTEFLMLVFLVGTIGGLEKTHKTQMELLKYVFLTKLGLTESDYTKFLLRFNDIPIEIQAKLVTYGLLFMKEGLEAKSFVKPLFFFAELRAFVYGTETRGKNNCR